MFDFLRRAHWADFEFDGGTINEKHRIMCSRCGHIVAETSADLEALLITGGSAPISTGTVIHLPKKCPTCGKRMKNSGEYSILPVVV